MFSVCIVAYGDHPDLINRLLSSLRLHEMKWEGFVADVRIGLNAVSDATHHLVGSTVAVSASVPCHLYIPFPDEKPDAQPLNVGKYPLMWRMFNDERRPLASHVMWFDDDSYLGEKARKEWWQRAFDECDGPVLVGRKHSIRQRGRQFEVVPRQPWFRGKPFPQNHRMTFATGAWWIASRNFLKEWDYPFPAIHHNGGDSILGELVRQQNGTIHEFSHAQCWCESCKRKRPRYNPEFVQINEGGRKGRRGIGRTNEFYVWQDGQEPTLEHHQFGCRVLTFGA